MLSIHSPLRGKIKRTSLCQFQFYSVVKSRFIIPLVVEHLTLSTLIFPAYVFVPSYGHWQDVRSLGGKTAHSVLTVMQQWQQFAECAYSLTFHPPAHQPDSKGYTCGAGKVCCRAYQQTGGRTKGETGSRETRGATEESTTGMFTLFSEWLATVQSTSRSTVLLMWFNTWRISCIFHTGEHCP